MALKVEGVHQIAQHAEDLERATEFYRDVLGLRHIATFDPPGLVFFDLGDGTRLLLEQGASSALLYLGVEDIDTSVEALRGAAVTIEGEPHVIFADEAGQFGPVGYEIRMAFFRDSEGNVVGLTESRPA
jgi:methylmalonyl-CoA/ethylmalonyl-CoA epimerase